METKIHFLKTHQGVYTNNWTGEKKFEIRKNDRDFKVGDYLYLQETRELVTEGLNEYTGNEMLVSVRFLLDGGQAEKYGLKPGYCAMSTVRMNTEVLIAIKSQMYRWDDKLAILFSRDEGIRIVKELSREWTEKDWNAYTKVTGLKKEKAIITLIRHAEKWYDEGQIEKKGMNLFDQAYEFRFFNRELELRNEQQVAE